jgi:hypothetical protein
LTKDNYAGYSTISKNGNALYLFVDAKTTMPVVLKGLNERVGSVRILDTKNVLSFNKSGENVSVTVPQESLGEYVTVLKVTLKK